MMLLRQLIGMGPPALDLAPGTPVCVTTRRHRSHEQKRYHRNMAYFHAAIDCAAELEAQHVPLPPELVAVTCHVQDAHEVDVRRLLGKFVFPPTVQPFLEKWLADAERDYNEWQHHGVLIDPADRSVQLFQDFILLNRIGYGRLHRDPSRYGPPEHTIQPVDIGIALKDLDKIIALSVNEPKAGMEGAVAVRAEHMLRSLRENIHAVYGADRVALVLDRYREPAPRTGVYVVEKCMDQRDDFGYYRQEKTCFVVRAEPWHAEKAVEKLLAVLEPADSYAAVEIPKEGLPLLQDVPARTLKLTLV